jgi:LemA protein
MCLRSTLLEARSTIHSEWQLFVREVRERNDLLPGLLEAVRSFQPGFAKTSDRIMEARAAINRSSTPDVIMPAVDQLDMYLRTIESIVNQKTELARHPSFGHHWQNVAKKNQEIAITRAHYNSSVRTYNYLLSVFPQTIFSSLFGYVRATEYPCPQNKGDQ